MADVAGEVEVLGIVALAHVLQLDETHGAALDEQREAERAACAPRLVVGDFRGRQAGVVETGDHQSWPVANASRVDASSARSTHRLDLGVGIPQGFAEFAGEQVQALAVKTVDVATSRSDEAEEAASHGVREAVDVEGLGDDLTELDQLAPGAYALLELSSKAALSKAPASSCPTLRMKSSWSL